MKRSDIVAVIRREMKLAEGFVMSSPAALPPAPVHISDDEALVGWYVNPPPWEVEILAFTDVALYQFCGEVVHRYAWDRLTGYELPSKDTGVGVKLRFPGGERLVHAAWRHGPGQRRMNAYSLVMVLHRLVGPGPLA